MTGVSRGFALHWFLLILVRYAQGLKQSTSTEAQPNVAEQMSSTCLEVLLKATQRPQKAHTQKMAPSIIFLWALIFCLHGASSRKGMFISTFHRMVSILPTPQNSVVSSKQKQRDE